MKNADSLTLIKRLKTMADTGLLYAENEFDRERYEELLEISHELTSRISGKKLQSLKEFYLPVKDYPTPKVDVRGLVLNANGEVLMAQEQSDQKWALPGGWCEIGFSPSEVIQKEIHEETGIEANPIRLLAVYDKKCHPHPPEPYYVYKLNFLCEVHGGELIKGHDILDVSYFSIDNLPPLSENRNTQNQIEQLYQLARDAQSPVHFD